MDVYACEAVMLNMILEPTFLMTDVVKSCLGYYNNRTAMGECASSTFVCLFIIRSLMRMSVQHSRIDSAV